MLKGILTLAFCVIQLWGAQQGGSIPSWALRSSVNLGPEFHCPETSARSYRISGVSIRVTAQTEITLDGKSRLGAAWSVRSSYPGDIPCRFYNYDLDKNGIADFIFVIPNAGSGPAGITLLVIAFDSNGRPIPWQATGPFVVGPKGVRNFIDADGDHRTELLYQYIEEVGQSRTLFSQTTLYQITEGEFRAVPSFAGHAFPVFEPYRVPLSGAPDLTNAMLAGLSTTALEMKVRKEEGPCWISGARLGEGGITLPTEADRLNCEGHIKGDNGNIPLPMMIVLDRPNGTRFVDIEHSISETTRRIVIDQMSVKFAGRSCEAGCRPLVMWAAKK